MANLKFDVDLNTNKAKQKLSSIRTAVSGRLEKGGEQVGTAAMNALMLPVTKGFGLVTESLGVAADNFWGKILSGLEKASDKVKLGANAGAATSNQLGMGAAFMSPEAISGVMDVNAEIIKLQDKGRQNVDDVRRNNPKYRPDWVGAAGHVVTGINEQIAKGETYAEEAALWLFNNEQLNRIGNGIDAMVAFYNKNAGKAMSMLFD